MYIPLDVYRSVYLLQVYTSILKSFKTLFSKMRKVNLLYEIGTLVKNKNCKEKVLKKIVKFQKLQVKSCPVLSSQLWQPWSGS